eukprot:5792089-Alexandrium_andersonii.AAC.1
MREHQHRTCAHAPRSTFAQSGRCAHPFAQASPPRSHRMGTLGGFKPPAADPPLRAAFDEPARFKREQLFAHRQTDLAKQMLAANAPVRVDLRLLLRGGVRLLLLVLLLLDLLDPPEAGVAQVD